MLSETKHPYALLPAGMLRKDLSMTVRHTGFDTNCVYFTALVEYAHPSNSCVQMMMKIPTFPQLSEERMRQMLSIPNGTIRVVIDTDTKNEIDDQFAITWALMRQDKLQIEGMYAAPFSFRHHRQPLLDAYEQVAQPSGADDKVVYAGKLP